jgi:hypothetical protein
VAQLEAQEISTLSVTGSSPVRGAVCRSSLHTQGEHMFDADNVVQIYDHADPIYNGKTGTICRIDVIRGHEFYMVEIDNRLVPCNEEELIEY